MTVRETLKTDGELHVTTTDDVLDLELRELGIEAKLLDDSRVLARRKPRVVLALRAGDDHLAGSEDEGGRLRVTNTHDDRGETLQSGMRREVRHSHTIRRHATNLGVVLCIARVQRDRLQVQPTIEVDRRDDVLERRDDAFDRSDVLLLESERGGGSRNSARARGGGTSEGGRLTGDGRLR